MNQRKWIVLWLALTAILIVIAQGRLWGQEWSVVEDDEWCDGRSESSCEVREVTLPAWDDVRVQTVNGGIEVDTWDRDEIRVRARIMVKGSDRADTMERIEIQADEDQIRASGPRSRGGILGLFGGRSWSVSFRVTVPRDSNVDAKTTNGGIVVAGVKGEVEFTSVNGGVKLLDVGGDVRGGTTNGGIKVSLGPEGWKGHEVDLQTTNGGIKIELPRDFSAQVDLATTNGGIDVEHPVQIERHTRTRLRGRIGDGGEVMLRARTTNGGVSIDRADA